jgi:hypothetical protein
MSVARGGCCGCVMSDGRFAVLGGQRIGGPISSCEGLVMGAAAHWEPLSPMHDSRTYISPHPCVRACNGSPGVSASRDYDVYSIV